MTPKARRTGTGYLRLAEDDWVLDALDTLPGLAEVPGHTVQQASQMRDSGTSVTTSFAVSSVPDDGLRGLSSVLPIESVHWPPLLILTRRGLAAWEREHLRRQGVSAVINVSEESDRAPRVVDTLMHSPDWFAATLSRASLADLLQMLSADRRSGMIWLGCPHNSAISQTRWETGGAFCGRSPEACSGWSARLYLSTGKLVYAETPTLNGLDAFSRCLSLKEGYLRVHELYMSPRVANLEGTVQQLLIRAAALADERQRTGDIPVPTSARRVPAGGPRQTFGSGAPVRGTSPPPLPEDSTPVPAPTSTPLSEVVGGPAGIRLAVDTHEGGAIAEVAGEGDADGAAAVATMCTAAFRSAGKRLKLGSLHGWCLLGQSMSLYVANDGPKSRLAVGPANDSTLRNLGLVFTRDGS